jgi:hypothetical protein
VVLVSYIYGHARLESDGVNGGINETGIKRDKMSHAFAPEKSVAPDADAYWVVTVERATGRVHSSGPYSEQAIDDVEEATSRMFPNRFVIRVGRRDVFPER